MRPAIEAVKGEKLVGVEIGVHRGDHALEILKGKDIKMLYLIDPYLKYDEYNDPDDWGDLSHDDFIENLHIATDRMAPYKEQVRFIFTKSEDALPGLPDGLDFVYVDGNHAYDYVIKDLEYYYPLLKAGGILGGDNLEEKFPGVVKAVLEFAGEHNLTLKIKTWTKSMDWWVIKNANI